MKESFHSLRLYFIAVGLLGLSALSAAELSIANTSVWMPQLIFSMAWLYLGLAIYLLRNIKRVTEQLKIGESGRQHRQYL